MGGKKDKSENTKFSVLPQSGEKKESGASDKEAAVDANEMSLALSSLSEGAAISETSSSTATSTISPHTWGIPKDLLRHPSTPQTKSNLEKIHSMLQSSSSRILAILGMPGTGKTELLHEYIQALCCNEMSTANVYNAIIYLPAQTLENEIRTCANEKFGHKFGEDVPHSAVKHALLDDFNSFHWQRILFVVDDVKEPEQLKSLYPLWQEDVYDEDSGSGTDDGSDEEPLWDSGGSGEPSPRATFHFLVSSRHCSGWEKSFSCQFSKLTLSSLPPSVNFQKYGHSGYLNMILGGLREESVNSLALLLDLISLGGDVGAQLMQRFQSSLTPGSATFPLQHHPVQRNKRELTKQEKSVVGDKRLFIDALQSLSRYGYIVSERRAGKVILKTNDLLRRILVWAFVQESGWRLPDGWSETSVHQFGYSIYMSEGSFHRLAVAAHDYVNEQASDLQSRVETVLPFLTALIEHLLNGHRIDSLTDKSSDSKYREILQIFWGSQLCVIWVDGVLPGHTQTIAGKLYTDSLQQEMERDWDYPKWPSSMLDKTGWEGESPAASTLSAIVGAKRWGKTFSNFYSSCINSHHSGEILRAILSPPVKVFCEGHGVLQEGQRRGHGVFPIVYRFKSQNAKSPWWGEAEIKIEDLVSKIVAGTKLGHPAHLIGNSGTGKSLVAAYVMHQISGDERFVLLVRPDIDAVLQKRGKVRERDFESCMAEYLCRSVYYQVPASHEVDSLPLEWKLKQILEGQRERITYIFEDMDSISDDFLDRHKESLNSIRLLATSKKIVPIKEEKALSVALSQFPCDSIRSFILDRFNEQREGVIKPEEFFGNIVGNMQSFHLARNPQHLGVLCKIKPKVPQHIFEVYHDHVERLLNDAVSILCSNAEICQVSEPKKKIEDVCIKLSTSGAEEFDTFSRDGVHEALVQCGLIQKEGFFSHDLFKQYFKALYMVRLAKDEKHIRDFPSFGEHTEECSFFMGALAQLEDISNQKKRAVIKALLFELREKSSVTATRLEQYSTIAFATIARFPSIPKILLDVEGATYIEEVITQEMSTYTGTKMLENFFVSVSESAFIMDFLFEPERSKLLENFELLFQQSMEIVRYLKGGVVCGNILERLKRGSGNVAVKFDCYPYQTALTATYLYRGMYRQAVESANELCREFKKKNKEYPYNFRIYQMMAVGARINGEYERAWKILCDGAPTVEKEKQRDVHATHSDLKYAAWGRYYFEKSEVLVGCINGLEKWNQKQYRLGYEALKLLYESLHWLSWEHEARYVMRVVSSIQDVCTMLMFHKSNIKHLHLNLSVDSLVKLCMQVVDMMLSIYFHEVIGEELPGIVDLEKSESKTDLFGETTQGARDVIDKSSHLLIDLVASYVKRQLLLETEAFEKNDGEQFPVGNYINRLFCLIQRKLSEFHIALCEQRLKELKEYYGDFVAKLKTHGHHAMRGTPELHRILTFKVGSFSQRSAGIQAITILNDLTPRRESQVGSKTLRLLKDHLSSKQGRIIYDPGNFSKRHMLRNFGRGKSLLHVVAMAGDVAFAQHVLEQKTCTYTVVNMQCEHGYSALHYAVAHNHIKLVSKLMDYGAQISIRSHAGYTPFMLAVLYNRHEIMKLFLEKFPVSLFSTDTEGHNPLHVCAYSHYPKSAGIILLVCAKFPFSRLPWFKDKENKLALAYAQGEIKNAILEFLSKLSLSEELLKRFGELNVPEIEHSSSFHHSNELGEWDAIDEYKRNFSKDESKDHHLKKAYILFYAIEKNYVSLFCEVWAGLTVDEHKGCAYVDKEKSVTFLEIAVSYERVEIVKSILSNYHKLSLGHWYPLHRAVAIGNAAIVSEIIKAFPQELTRICDGWTILHELVSCRDLERRKDVLNVLKKCPGTINGLLGKAGNCGMTALHFLALSGETSTFELIWNSLDRNGRENFTRIMETEDYVGITPLSLLPAKNSVFFSSLGTESVPLFTALDHEQVRRESNEMLLRDFNYNIEQLSHCVEDDISQLIFVPSVGKKRRKFLTLLVSVGAEEDDLIITIDRLKSGKFERYIRTKVNGAKPDFEQMKKGGCVSLRGMLYKEKLLLGWRNGVCNLFLIDIMTSPKLVDRQHAYKTTIASSGKWAGCRSFSFIYDSQQHRPCVLIGYLDGSCQLACYDSNEWHFQESNLELKDGEVLIRDLPRVGLQKNAVSLVRSLDIIGEDSSVFYDVCFVQGGRIVLCKITRWPDENRLTLSIRRYININGHLRTCRMLPFLDELGSVLVYTTLDSVKVMPMSSGRSFALLRNVDSPIEDVYFLDHGHCIFFRTIEFAALLDRTTNKYLWRINAAELSQNLGIELSGLFVHIAQKEYRVMAVISGQLYSLFSSSVITEKAVKQDLPGSWRGVCSDRRMESSQSLMVLTNSSDISPKSVEPLDKQLIGLLREEKSSKKRWEGFSQSIKKHLVESPTLFDAGLFHLYRDWGQCVAHQLVKLRKEKFKGRITQNELMLSLLKKNESFVIVFGYNKSGVSILTREGSFHQSVRYIVDLYNVLWEVIVDGEFSHVYPRLSLHFNPYPLWPEVQSIYGHRLEKVFLPKLLVPEDLLSELGMVLIDEMVFLDNIAYLRFCFPNDDFLPPPIILEKLINAVSTQLRLIDDEPSKIAALYLLQKLSYLSKSNNELEPLLYEIYFSLGYYKHFFEFYNENKKGNVVVERLLKVEHTPRPRPPKNHFEAVKFSDLSRNYGVVFKERVLNVGDFGTCHRLTTSSYFCGSPVSSFYYWYNLYESVYTNLPKMQASVEVSKDIRIVCLDLIFWLLTFLRDSFSIELMLSVLDTAKELLPSREKSITQKENDFEALMWWQRYDMLNAHYLCLMNKDIEELEKDLSDHYRSFSSITAQSYPQKMAEYMIYIGHCRFAQVGPHEALRYYHQAFDCMSHTDFQTPVGLELLNTVAIYYFVVGDFKEAECRYEHLFSILQEVLDRGRVGKKSFLYTRITANYLLLKCCSIIAKPVESVELRAAEQGRVFWTQLFELMESISDSIEELPSILDSLSNKMPLFKSLSVKSNQQCVQTSRQVELKDGAKKRKVLLNVVKEAYSSYKKIYAVSLRDSDSFRPLSGLDAMRSIGCFLSVYYRIIDISPDYPVYVKLKSVLLEYVKKIAPILTSKEETFNQLLIDLSKESSETHSSLGFSSVMRASEEHTLTRSRRIGHSRETSVDSVQSVDVKSTRSLPPACLGMLKEAREQHSRRFRADQEYIYKYPMVCSHVANPTAETLHSKDRLTTTQEITLSNLAEKIIKHKGIGYILGRSGMGKSLLASKLSQPVADNEQWLFLIDLGVRYQPTIREEKNQFFNDFEAWVANYYDGCFPTGLLDFEGDTPSRRRDTFASWLRDNHKHVTYIVDHCDSVFCEPSIFTALLMSNKRSKVTNCILVLNDITRLLEQVKESPLPGHAWSIEGMSFASVLDCLEMEARQVKEKGEKVSNSLREYIFADQALLSDRMADQGLLSDMLRNPCLMSYFLEGLRVVDKNKNISVPKKRAYSLSKEKGKGAFDVYYIWDTIIRAHLSEIVNSESLDYKEVINCCLELARGEFSSKNNNIRLALRWKGFLDHNWSFSHEFVFDYFWGVAEAQRYCDDQPRVFSPSIGRQSSNRIVALLCALSKNYEDGAKKDVVQTVFNQLILGLTNGSIPIICESDDYVSQEWHMLTTCFSHLPMRAKEILETSVLDKIRALFLKKLCSDSTIRELESFLTIVSKSVFLRSMLDEYGSDLRRVFFQRIRQYEKPIRYLESGMVYLRLLGHIGGYERETLLLEKVQKISVYLYQGRYTEANNLVQCSISQHDSLLTGSSESSSMKQETFQFYVYAAQAASLSGYHNKAWAFHKMIGSYDSNTENRGHRLRERAMLMYTIFRSEDFTQNMTPAQYEWGWHSLNILYEALHWISVSDEPDCFLRTVLCFRELSTTLECFQGGFGNDYRHQQIATYHFLINGMLENLSCLDGIKSRKHEGKPHSMSATIQELEAVLEQQPSLWLGLAASEIKRLMLFSDALSGGKFEVREIDTLFKHAESRLQRCYAWRHVKGFQAFKKEYERFKNEYQTGQVTEELSHAYRTFLMEFFSACLSLEKPCSVENEDQLRQLKSEILHDLPFESVHADIGTDALKERWLSLLTELRTSCGESSRVVLMDKALQDFCRENVKKRFNGGYTLLHYAAAYNVAVAVSTLLNAGASLTSVSDDGRTPLSCAVMYRAHATVRQLLAYSPLTVFTREIYGYNPLHIVAYMGYEDIAGILLVSIYHVWYGKSVLLMPDVSGFIPSDYARDCGYDEIGKLFMTDNDTHQDHASNQTYRDVFNAESQAQARTALGRISKTDLEDKTILRTFLRYAAEKNYVSLFNDIVADASGRGVDTTDLLFPQANRPFLLLERASSSGSVEVLKNLLLYARQCDIKYPDDYHWSPFHRAAQKGNYEVLSVLIKSDFLGDITNAVSQTWSPLHELVTCVHVDKIQQTLDVIATFLKSRPLRQRREAVARLFNKDNNGFNPLHLLTIMKRFVVIDQLCSAFDEPYISKLMNEEDVLGLSPRKILSLDGYRYQYEGVFPQITLRETCSASVGEMDVTVVRRSNSYGQRSIVSIKCYEGNDEVRRDVGIVSVCCDRSSDPSEIKFVVDRIKDGEAIEWCSANVSGNVLSLSRHVTYSMVSIRQKKAYFHNLFWLNASYELCGFKFHGTCTAIVEIVRLNKVTAFSLMLGVHGCSIVACHTDGTIGYYELRDGAHETPILERKALGRSFQSTGILDTVMANHLTLRSKIASIVVYTVGFHYESNLTVLVVEAERISIYSLVLGTDRCSFELQHVINTIDFITASCLLEQWGQSLIYGCSRQLWILALPSRRERVLDPDVGGQIKEICAISGAKSRGDNILVQTTGSDLSQDKKEVGLKLYCMEDGGYTTFCQPRGFVEKYNFLQGHVWSRQLNTENEGVLFAESNGSILQFSLQGLFSGFSKFTREAYAREVINTGRSFMILPEASDLEPYIGSEECIQKNSRFMRESFESDERLFMQGTYRIYPRYESAAAAIMQVLMHDSRGRHSSKIARQLLLAKLKRQSKRFLVVLGYNQAGVEWLTRSGEFHRAVCYIVDFSDILRDEGDGVVYNSFIRINSYFDSAPYNLLLPSESMSDTGPIVLPLFVVKSLFANLGWETRLWSFNGVRFVDDKSGFIHVSENSENFEKKICRIEGIRYVAVACDFVKKSCGLDRGNILKGVLRTLYRELEIHGPITPYINFLSQGFMRLFGYVKGPEFSILGALFASRQELRLDSFLRAVSGLIGAGNVSLGSPGSVGNYLGYRTNQSIALLCEYGKASTYVFDDERMKLEKVLCDKLSGRFVFDAGSNYALSSYYMGDIYQSLRMFTLLYAALPETKYLQGLQVISCLLLSSIEGLRLPEFDTCLLGRAQLLCQKVEEDLATLSTDEVRRFIYYWHYTRLFEIYKEFVWRMNPVSNSPLRKKITELLSSSKKDFSILLTDRIQAEELLCIGSFYLATEQLVKAEKFFQSALQVVLATDFQSLKSIELMHDIAVFFFRVGSDNQAGHLFKEIYALYLNAVTATKLSSRSALAIKIRATYIMMSYCQQIHTRIDELTYASDAALTPLTDVAVKELLSNISEYVEMISKCLLYIDKVAAPLFRANESTANESTANESTANESTDVSVEEYFECLQFYKELYEKTLENTDVDTAWFDGVCCFLMIYRAIGSQMQRYEFTGLDKIICSYIDKIFANLSPDMRTHIAKHLPAGEAALLSPALPPSRGHGQSEMVGRQRMTSIEQYLPAEEAALLSPALPPSRSHGQSEMVGRQHMTSIERHCQSPTLHDSADTLRISNEFEKPGLAGAAAFSQLFESSCSATADSEGDRFSAAPQ